MRIEIAQKLRPFSHSYLARCRIPGQGMAKIVPSSIEVAGQIQALPIQGPVRGFTTTLNLEKGILSVFGHYSSGYFREDIPFQAPSPTIEKVAFGCHKAQNWDCMLARRQLEELLPHWHRLAQWEGDITQMEPARENTLLGQCQNSDRHTVGEALINLFDGAFTDYFVDAPQRWHQLGLPFPASDGQNVLVQGAARLRRALIAANQTALWVLPVLPKELLCGRYLNAYFPWATIDFEWSKGLIRRMVLRATDSVSVLLHFQKDVATFRLTKEKTSYYLTNNVTIDIEAGKAYYFDRFEK